MQISYLGHYCFHLINSKGKSLIIDPYDPAIGYKDPLQRADFTLVSCDLQEHAHLASVLGSTLVVKGASQRKLGGYVIRGHVAESGGYPVTCFEIDTDGMKLVHLSRADALPSSLLPKSGGIDVVFFPCGGPPAMTAEQAVKALERLQPRIAIPMGFRTPFLKGNLFMSLRSIQDLRNLITLNYNQESFLDLTPPLPEPTRFVLLPHAC